MTQPTNRRLATEAALATGLATKVNSSLVSSALPFKPGEIHGQTTSAKALVVIGMTGTGRIWARDATGGNLSQSDDWGVTWKHGCGVPAGTSSGDLVKIVQFGGYFYATLLDTTSGLWGVYRTPAVAQGAVYTWSAQLFTLPTGVTNQIRTCLTADAQNLYLGGYTTGATVESRVWKSSNGTTWTVAYDVNTVGAGWRHIHAISVDPYHAGHVYVAVGDNSSPVCIARSRDYGATWETVISGAGGNEWQSVQISFSEQWVWVASDRIGFDALVFDRDAKIPYVAHQGWHYNLPVVPAATLADRYYQIGYWGAVDPATGVFHFVAADSSSAGNTKGYFRIPHLGAPVELVETLPTSETAGEVWIGNGYVWIGSRRWKSAITAVIPAS